MSAQVMIVDDLLQNIKVLKAKLEREFYQVVTAVNGVDALQKLENGYPDIILLDVMMPEMDGLETCRRIKSDPNLADIPVVMVTALTDKSDRIAGLEAGADDFLTKPINDTAMFARIRSLVRFKTMTDALKLRAQTGAEFGETGLSMARISDFSGSRALVMESDMAQASQIRDVLHKLGVETVIISEAAQAVQELFTDPYDLIIIDSGVAESNSLNLCATLKSQEQTSAIPLVLLIEEEDEELLARGYDIGINDYLLTPLDSNEIRARCTIQIKRKKYQDALLQDQRRNLTLSQMDGLTGLYNRRYFDSYFLHNLREAIEQSKPLSLMILDVDHFKSINDRFGHLAGDAALQSIAKSIKVRASDLVARYGGEEFAVVMPNTPISVAATVAERIRQSIENEALELPGAENPVKITISVGLSCALRTDTVDALIKRADMALYHIKHTSRNRVAVYVCN